MGDEIPSGPEEVLSLREHSNLSTSSVELWMWDKAG